MGIVTNIHSTTMDAKTFGWIFLLVVILIDMANGIKCYTCTACPESDIGKQEDCEPQFDACSKIKTKIKGKEIHKKCFTKGKGKPGGVLEKITGVGCVGNACVCDTDLCNGSSTLEMRPIIF